MRKTIFGMEVERFIGGVSSNLNVAGDITPEPNVFSKFIAAEKAAKRATKAAKKAANKVLAEKKTAKETKKGAKTTAPKGRPTPKRERKRGIVIEMPEVEKKVEYSPEYLTALEKVRKGGAKGLVAKLMADALSKEGCKTTPKEFWDGEAGKWAKSSSRVVVRLGEYFIAEFEGDQITEFGHIFEDAMKKDYEAFIESEINKRVSVEGRFVKETAKYFANTELKEKHRRTPLALIAKVAELAEKFDITIKRSCWEMSIECIERAVITHGKYAERALQYAVEFSRLEQLQDKERYLTGVHLGDLMRTIVRVMPTRLVYQAKKNELRNFMLNKVLFGGLGRKFKKNMTKFLTLNTNAMLENLDRYFAAGMLSQGYYNAAKDSKKFQAKKRKDVWRETHGRVPKNHVLLLKMPTKNFKKFQQALKLIPTPTFENRHEYYAVMHMLYLGFSVEQIKIVLDAKLSQVIPSLTKEVDGLSEANEKFIARAISELGISGETLGKICLVLKNKVQSEITDGALKDAPLSVLFKKTITLDFEFDPECVDLAIEHAKWNGSCDYSVRIEEKFKDAKKAESIPAVEISIEEYKFRKLDSGDVRQLYMGDYTDCCQKVRGAGESCVWHSWKSPEGATFVVEKNNKIIAQSWAWRNNRHLVFDNIEMLSGHLGNNKVLELYKKAAVLLKGKLGIEFFQIGLGHNDCSQLDSLKKVEADEMVESPKGVYSDADYNRVWLEV